MLRWFSIPRFAPQSSPEKERRLLQFSSGAPTSGNAASEHEAPDDHGTHAPDMGHDSAHGDSHGAEHDHEAGHHDAVGHGQSHAHGAIKYVLTNKSTAERIEHTEQKIRSVTENLKTIEDIARNKMPKEEQDKHLNAIEANREFLDDTMMTMDSWKRLTNVIEDWEGGKLDPGEFFYEVQRYMAKDDKTVVSAALEHFFSVNPDARNWDTLNTGTKVGMARTTAKDLLKYMQDYMEKLEKELEKQERHTKELEKARVAMEKADTGGGGWGIEFFNIYQIIEAAGNVTEAFQNAYKEWSQLKVAGLSNTFGKLVKHLPGGDSAQQTLAASLEHKNDDVRKHYAEHLEADLVPFWEMIPNHHNQGFLERNKGNANRFVGSLDYMAKKGWIYELDADNRTVMGHKLIKGKTVPADWTDERIKQYIDELDSKNQSGQKGETERGRNRVDYVATIPKGIKAMISEMKDGNYWAIRGMMNRLLEKAKIGHTATWIVTTIWRTLRSDPIARRYFPIELLDRLGNEGLLHLPSTNFFWVLDKSSIRDWADATWIDNGLAEKEIESAGTFGRLTKEIETDIRQRERNGHVSRPLEPPELDEVVAKIMATQIIKLPGWDRPISLFSDNYNWYRDQFKRTEGTTVKPETTDDDFMKDDSEIVLHGKEVAAAIVAVRSPGDFQIRSKALAYLGQLLRRKHQLESFGLIHEMENFQKETQEVFKDIFNVTWGKGDVANFINFQHSEAGDKFLLQALTEEGLISRDFIATLDTKLATALRKQMGIPEPRGGGGGGNP